VKSGFLQKIKHPCTLQQHATMFAQLLCRHLRAAAVAELQEIFDQALYSSSDKKVQQAIFEHLLVAAQQRDR